MNIKYLTRRVISQIMGVLPGSFHKALLKQYVFDRGVPRKNGFMVMEQNWSSPVAVAEELDTSLLGQKRDLPGLTFPNSDFLRLGDELAPYGKEFPWRDNATADPEVPWGEMFPTLDSIVLYSMIRKFKPKKYIEVGCGFSSRVSSAAARRNNEQEKVTSVSYIEPYPGPRLDQEGLSGELIQKRIQDVDLGVFSSMDAGDMLFIDTSHVLKAQSDVEWELLHILPLLKPGVIVHIHDLYTPYEQPVGWLENNYAPGMYNEQYAVEAMLSGGTRYRTLFPLHMLCRENAEDLRTWFSVNPDSSRSYWIIVN